MTTQIPGKELFIGASLAARDHDGLTLDLNSLLVKNESATYFFKVSGNSMRSARIFSGDILIVDRSLSPSDGNTIVAVINDELTIRRIRLLGHTIFLENDDDAEAPIEVTSEMESTLWGVVTHIIHETL